MGMTQARRISQGAKGEPPVSLFSATPQTQLATWRSRPLKSSQVVGLGRLRLCHPRNHPADSFSGFFSGLFVGGGEGLFVAISLGALAFSPAFSVTRDYLLAASF